MLLNTTAEVLRGAWPKLPEKMLSSKSFAPSQFITLTVFALDAANRKQSR